MTIQGADPLKMFFAPFVAEDMPNLDSETSGKAKLARTLVTF